MGGLAEQIGLVSGGIRFACTIPSTSASASVALRCQLGRLGSQSGLGSGGLGQGQPVVRLARALPFCRRAAWLVGVLACVVAVCSGGCGSGSSLGGLLSGGKWGFACGPAKAVGQFCKFTEECVAGAYCDTAKEVCSNQWLAKGASCANNSAQCTAGTYCGGFVDVGTCYSATCDAAGACTSGAVTGKSCPGDGSAPTCGPNTLCIISSGLSGACIALPTAGQTCPGLGMCASGLVCSPDIGTCQSPTALGGPCRIKETCAAGLQCLNSKNQVNDSPLPNSGLCKANPNGQTGSPCVGAVCAPGLHCDYSVNVNKCAKDYKIGASCSQGNECGESPGIAADCVQGVCVATDKVGAKCWPGPEQRCTGAMQCVSQP